MVSQPSSFARILTRLAALLLAAIVTPVSHAADPRSASDRGELRAWASLPADTFRGGPPSGQFNDRSERAAVARFATQPVQGVSSIKPARTAGEWWALSDNGFGTKWNSADYELVIYRFAVAPRDRQRREPAIELREVVRLRDPQRRFPYRMTLEQTADRVFTGADLDPESMVIAPDGSFWISDEFGPWLLHFARDGELLGAPHELPDGLRSPQHPLVLSGAAVATVAASRGGEGLAASADGRSLWFALESPLAADMTAANGDDDSVVRFVRVYRYDLASGSFSPNYLRLPLAPGTTAIGEVALQSGDRYLVVERDDGFGATAKHKRVRRLRWNGNSAIDEGVVANLLDIADPARIAAQTDAAGTYRMPYFTIEAVHAIDATTILVVNDNNYPATGARGSDIKDSTEWAWIALPALASPKPRVRP